MIYHLKMARLEAKKSVEKAKERIRCPSTEMFIYALQAMYRKSSSPLWLPAKILLREYPPSWR
jgi:hypothetical protein